MICLFKLTFKILIMTNEELEIGAKWMTILNAYSTDFGTKALFNQTANFLKGKHNNTGGRVSKFQKEIKYNPSGEPIVVEKPKQITLLEAAKIREAKREQNEQEDEEGAGNLLAIGETDEYTELKTMKKGKKNV
jgi:hypothetical protein